MNMGQSDYVPHLVYVNGEMDFSPLQEIVESVPNVALGPFCWIVKIPANSARQFLERLTNALPKVQIPDVVRCEIEVCLIGDVRASFSEGGRDAVFRFLGD